MEMEKIWVQPDPVPDMQENYGPPQPKIANVNAMKTILLLEKMNENVWTTCQVILDIQFNIWITKLSNKKNKCQISK